MAIKNEVQKIEDLTIKIKQLLEARAKDRERKERTRRLIQIGGILNLIGIDTIEKAKLLKSNITNNPKAKEWFEKLYIENKEVEEPKTV